MSSRIKVLIVGTGRIGERHLRCFGATNRADLSLCEINAAQRDRVAARYHVQETFADFAEAIRSRPQAVVICTPAQLHIPMAIAAAQDGAHLLIEKPLSINLDGIDLLQQEVKHRQRIAVVAYVYRAHPALAAMREAIRSGRFGEPVEIVATCGQNFPFYQPEYRESYYHDHATGGGAVQDALTHVINAGEWLVGPVDRLVADIGRQVLEGVVVEDTTHVLTRHGGVMGCYSLNQHQPANEVSITVICQRGMARFEYHRRRWRWTVEPEGAWRDETIEGLERDTLFTIQAEAFLDAVGGDKAPLCALEEGKQTLRVNMAILESAKELCWVSIPPPHQAT